MITLTEILQVWRYFFDESAKGLPKIINRRFSGGWEFKLIKYLEKKWNIISTVIRF